MVVAGVRTRCDKCNEILRCTADGLSWGDKNEGCNRPGGTLGILFCSVVFCAGGRMIRCGGAWGASLCVWK